MWTHLIVLPVIPENSLIQVDLWLQTESGTSKALLFKRNTEQNVLLNVHLISGSIGPRAGKIVLIPWSTSIRLIFIRLGRVSGVLVFRCCCLPWGPQLMPYTLGECAKSLLSAGSLTLNLYFFLKMKVGTTHTHTDIFRSHIFRLWILLENWHFPY